MSSFMLTYLSGMNIPLEGVANGESRYGVDSSLAWLWFFEVLFEQLENALVFVRPTFGTHEGVILDRIKRHRPVFLAQFDQLLRQPHRVLEEHVRIHHPVQHQQRALQPIGEEYRGRATER